MTFSVSLEGSHSFICDKKNIDTPANVTFGASSVYSLLPFMWRKVHQNRRWIPFMWQIVHHYLSLQCYMWHLVHLAVPFPSVCVTFGAWWDGSDELLWQMVHMPKVTFSAWFPALPHSLCDKWCMTTTWGGIASSDKWCMRKKPESPLHVTNSASEITFPLPFMWHMVQSLQVTFSACCGFFMWQMVQESVGISLNSMKISNNFKWHYCHVCHIVV